MMIANHHSIIPTEVGISSGWALSPAMPASAGMTEDMI